MSIKVLVVEDDREIRGLLRTALAAEGFEVLTAVSVSEATALLAHDPPDLIVLDLGLPDGDGAELVRAVRRHSALPIVVASARQEQAGKIALLDAGADDYLVKPFSFRELLARMRALLRRTETAEPGPLVFDDLTYEPDSREVVRQGETVRLTVREGALFELLLRRRGKVVTRTEIQARIWEDSFELSTNIIDVYINALRKKIDGGEREKLIQTVRGVGYRLRDAGGPAA